MPIVIEDEDIIRYGHMKIFYYTILVQIRKILADGKKWTFTDIMNNPLIKQTLNEERVLYTAQLKRVLDSMVKSGEISEGRIGGTRLVYQIRSKKQE